MPVRTDPPVSEAQRRAMFAAKSGNSNIGIPQSVGKEFAEADPGGKLPEHARSDAYDADGRAVLRKSGMALIEGIGRDGGSWFVQQRNGNWKRFSNRGDAEAFMRSQEYDDSRLDACQAALDELTSRMDAVERSDFSSAGARKAARVLESRGMDSAGRRDDAKEYETSSAFRGKVKVKVITPSREPGGVARVEVVEGPYKGEKFWDHPPDA